MKPAVSIALIHQLAGAEAAAGDWGEILPEHLFIAILKFAEISNEPNLLGIADRAAADQFAAPAVAVRDRLRAISIDPTTVRRKLRARLGSGGKKFAGERLSRSPEARATFDAAEKIAAKENLAEFGPEHLLTALLNAATAAMQDVLGPDWKHAAEPAPVAVSTPLLDQHGRDLTKLAAEGTLRAPTDRAAECKVLIDRLTKSSRPGIFLLADNTSLSDAVLMAAAAACQDPSAEKTAKGLRLIDIRECETPVRALDATAEAPLEVFPLLLREAITHPGVVLIHHGGGRFRGDRRALDLSKRFLKEHGLRIIFAWKPQHYERLIQSDREWSRLGWPIWIQAEAAASIPEEI